MSEQITEYLLAQMPRDRLEQVLRDQAAEIERLKEGGMCTWHSCRERDRQNLERAVIEAARAVEKTGAEFMAATSWDERGDLATDWFTAVGTMCKRVRAMDAKPAGTEKRT